MQYDRDQLLRMAQSSQGQQLLTLLQKKGGAQLQNAISRASGGDYEGAKTILSSLLATPEAKALMKQLEEQS